MYTLRASDGAEIWNKSDELYASVAKADLDGNALNGDEVCCLIINGDNTFDLRAFYGDGADFWVQENTTLMPWGTLREALFTGDLDNNLSNGMEIVAPGVAYVKAMRGNTGSPYWRADFERMAGPPTGLAVGNLRDDYAGDEVVLAGNFMPTGAPGLLIPKMFALRGDNGKQIWAKDTSIAYYSLAIGNHATGVSGREVAGVHNGIVSLYNRLGSHLWSEQISEDDLVSLAVGDLDGNTSNGEEIVTCTADGDIFIRKTDGTWAGGYIDEVCNNLTVADVDGYASNGLEILVATDDGDIYALTFDGGLQQLWKRRITANRLACVVAGDIRAGKITGHVFDENLIGLEEATVTINGGDYNTDTDENGYFEQGWLGTGIYTVSASYQDYPFDSVDVPVDNNVVNVDIRTYMISGYVERYQTEEKVNGIDIRITGGNTPIDVTVETGAAGEDGYYEKRVAGGDYNVEASNP